VRFELTGLSSSGFQVWVRALADCGGVTRAIGALGISQPAVSRRVISRDRACYSPTADAFAAFVEAGSWRASVYALGTTD
jgi:hypothetical protein